MTALWTWQGLARAATIAAVAAGTGAALGYLVAHEPAPRAQSAPTAKAPVVTPEQALLSPLREGSVLAGFDVAEIHGIGDDGVLRIVCRKARTAVRLDVALAADGGAAPAVRGGPYAVFYTVENVAPAEGERLAAALAAVLAANAGAPPPASLRVLVR